MNNEFFIFRHQSTAMKFGVILCLFLFGLFLSATIISVLSKWSFLQSHAYIHQVVMLFISSIGTFLLPAWLCGIIYGKNLTSYLKINVPKRREIFLWSFLLVFIALPFVQYTAFLNQLITLPSSLMEIEKKANEQLQSLLQIRTFSAIIINIFLIGILPAIVEELFFRSVLQKTIYDIMRKAWVSILIASFIFSFLHFQFLGFCPRLVLGILLGILFQYSQSVFPSMLFHATFNSFQLILYYTFHVDLDQINQKDINTWSFLVLAIISLGSVYFVIKNKILAQ
ncbi:MAG: lysostaphin resistance A-like protein [Chitinophagaceae bacterium]